MLKSIYAALLNFAVATKRKRTHSNSDKLKATVRLGTEKRDEHRYSGKNRDEIKPEIK